MDVINITRVNPDTGEYWPGELLAQNDPEAWTNTLAFFGRPSIDAVNEHIAHCKRDGYSMDDLAPVRYSFGIRWDPVSDLRLSHGRPVTPFYLDTPETTAPTMVPGEGAPQYVMPGIDLPTDTQLSLL